MVNNGRKDKRINFDIVVFIILERKNIFGDDCMRAWKGYDLNKRVKYLLTILRKEKIIENQESYTKPIWKLVKR